MRLLAELFFTAMAIVIQLGVPVVVIFIAAFLAERAKRRRLDLRASGPSNGNPLARLLVWLTSEEAEIPDQVRASLCPSRDAYRQPIAAAEGTACWQTMKADNGRLRSECVDCQAFLSPTTAG